MTPLRGDEIAVLVKARDLLYAKQDSGEMTVRVAYVALLDMLKHSYVDVP